MGKPKLITSMYGDLTKGWDELGDSLRPEVSTTEGRVETAEDEAPGPDGDQPWADDEWT